MTKDYNNEILNDCSWFADKHRGKNKQSGPYWSTIIRFTPLFDEAVRLQNQFRTLLKSIEVGDAKQMDIDKLQAENEKLKKMLAYIRDYSDVGIDEDLNGWSRVKQIQMLAQQALNEVTNE
jgi:hypothetical protein